MVDRQWRWHTSQTKRIGKLEIRYGQIQFANVVGRYLDHWGKEFAVEIVDENGEGILIHQEDLSEINDIIGDVYLKMIQEENRLNEQS